jgi:hypothetical protein
MKKIFDDLTSRPGGSRVDYKHRPRTFIIVTYNKRIEHTGGEAMYL